MLEAFLTQHRTELIARARAKVLKRTPASPSEGELTNGVPLFLTQLGKILHAATSGDDAGKKAAVSASSSETMDQSATEHGGDLLRQGFTIAQVVHDYGDICQAITELALERTESISTEEFHTLNRCLDDAIANAVSEFGRQRADKETEQKGFLAHELRNRLNTALLSFQGIKSGRVGVSGSTMEVLGRSLMGIRTLIDRSLSEVRVSSAMQNNERLRVAEVVEEIEIAAQLDANERKVQLTIEPVEYDLFIQGDRHLLSSAVSNLLQNAFKFTRSAGHVWLRARAKARRVAIEIEDQCGGLPPGKAETLFQPYDQRGSDRSGLGLGLPISRSAIQAIGGDISFLNKPGVGCVFTIDLPRG